MSKPETPTGAEYLKSLLGYTEKKDVDSYLESTEQKEKLPKKLAYNSSANKSKTSDCVNAEARLEKARAEIYKSCGGPEATGFDFEEEEETKGGRKSKRRLRSTTRSKRRSTSHRRRRSTRRR